MARRHDRAQVLAYRAWAQGPHGEDTLAGLDVLEKQADVVAAARAHGGKVVVAVE